jgi:uncharacterized protein (DUF1330 family)
MMQAADARFLVRGDPAKVYEAGLMMRTVVIEFDSNLPQAAAREQKQQQGVHVTAP